MTNEIKDERTVVDARDLLMYLGYDPGVYEEIMKCESKEEIKALKRKRPSQLNVKTNL